MPHSYDDKIMINKLKLWKFQKGRYPTWNEASESNFLPHPTTYRSHFGSFLNAKRLAAGESKIGFENYKNTVNGELIKQDRIETGLTQKELSYLINVDRTTIAKWEVNRNDPRYENLMRLAIMMGTCLCRYIRHGYSIDNLRRGV